jgi:hypothetical protein
MSQRNLEIQPEDNILQNAGFTDRRYKIVNNDTGKEIAWNLTYEEAVARLAEEMIKDHQG